MKTDPVYKESLTNERVKVLVRLSQLDIDIYVLERTSPDLVVATEKMTPQSSREISAKQMLERYRNDRSGMEKRLQAIEELLK